MDKPKTRLIFGSEVYAKVLGPIKKLLDERSKKYVFLEYGLNGYQLFDE